MGLSLYEEALELSKPTFKYRWFEEVADPEMKLQLQQVKRAWHAGELPVSKTALHKLVLEHGVVVGLTSFRTWLDDREEPVGQRPKASVGCGRP